MTDDKALVERLEAAKEAGDKHLVAFLEELQESRVRIPGLVQQCGAAVAEAYAVKDDIGDLRSGALVLLNRIQQVLDKH